MRNERRLTLIPKVWGTERGRDGDSTLAYDVAGLPPNLAVEIAELHGRWQLIVTRDGIPGDWQGDFDTADAALMVLEAEVAHLPGY